MCMETTEVKGRMTHYVAGRGFIYVYTCEGCEREFRDTAPETKPPVLCHRCYTGTDLVRKRRLQRKLTATYLCPDQL